MSFFAGLRPSRLMPVSRGDNMLAGAAPFYRCYTCADGRYVSVGAIEPQFYRELVTLIGAPEDLLIERADRTRWPAHVETLARRSSDEWAIPLEGSNACVTRVVPLDEAHDHQHLVERGSFVEHDGLRLVAPVPRFSRTPGQIQDNSKAAAMIARWSRIDET